MTYHNKVVLYTHTHTHTHTHIYIEREREKAGKVKYRREAGTKVNHIGRARLSQDLTFPWVGRVQGNNRTTSAFQLYFYCMCMGVYVLFS